MIAAAGLDRLIGDPRWCPHPVVVMGWWIHRLRRLAEARGLSPLLLLAFDDELQRLTRSAQSLALASRHDDDAPMTAPR